MLLPPQLIMDSCNARKLDPGFAAQYSMPRVLMTSIMKSEPGFSLPETSAGLVDAAGLLRGSDCWGLAKGACAARAAAPAAPRRNPRRSIGFFDFDIMTAPPAVQL